MHELLVIALHCAVFLHFSIANAQSLELEKSNHLELMNCYIHLLEQESEIQVSLHLIIV